MKLTDGKSVDACQVWLWTRSFVHDPPSWITPREKVSTFMSQLAHKHVDMDCTLHEWLLSCLGPEDPLFSRVKVIITCQKVMIMS